MDFFVITQADWKAERDRLITEIETGEFTNPRAADLSPIASLESFCRVYYCAVALATKRMPRRRGRLHRGAYEFLRETREMASNALVLHSSSSQDPDGEIEEMLRGINTTIMVLEGHLPPEGIAEQEEKPEPPQTPLAILQGAVQLALDDMRYHNLPDWLKPIEASLIEANLEAHALAAPPQTPPGCTDPESLENSIGNGNSQDSDS